MPEPRRSGRRLSRETRLLIVTITVSAVVLVLLARLRFPEPPRAVEITAQPLERLAVRASYDELARSVARLEESIAPDLIVLRLAPQGVSTPQRLSDVLARPDASSSGVGHVPAVRIDGATAIASIDPGARITGIVGSSDPSATAGILAVDPIRRIARVRVPERPARRLPQRLLSELATPTYVVAVEGTHAGLTLRPVFVGRADRFASPRWTRPLLPLGGAVVTRGALFFTLDGAFLGSAVVEDGMLAIVGARDLLDTAERLTSMPAPPADPGLAVQPLTVALSFATGASRGVVVSEVFPGGPAAGVLEAGDVITELDGQTVDSPEHVLLRLGTSYGDEPVSITVVRNGETRSATLRGHRGPVPASTDDDALTFASVPGAGTAMTAVHPGSPFEAAGLSAGDLIVRAGNVSAPTPAQVRRAIADTDPGDFLLLAVRRDDRQRVVAVQMPPHTDAAR